ncbi:MAG TPA: lipoyl(octanoyl) transferase LipB [Solirubrobacteraceae bacterium]|jgi:lipoyl(octanoyl) transferase|nr:lipoyl(octanoyl) transferase LipB [Solirubrobacteraceae bacterium]
MIEAKPSSPELWVHHLGTASYRDALALQLHIRELRLTGELPDTLLLLEHPPVYTRGRRSAPGELTLGEDLYRARGIEVVETDRGGRVTYHGPGQLVGYPIMRVDDIGAHLRTMEAAIIAALAGYGVKARSRCEEGPDYTGVWVEDRKIASIGVHVSRGIATHGFAVNVDVDLAPFSWVIACGLPDVTMTSIARELPSGRTIDPDGFRTRMADHFADACHRRPRAVSRSELMRGRIPIGDRRDLRSASANPRRAGTACADAGRSLIGQSPTAPDALTPVTGHGAPV